MVDFLIGFRMSDLKIAKLMYYGISNDGMEKMEKLMEFLDAAKSSGNKKGHM